MALEALLEALRRQSRAECEAALETARAEAERIRADARGSFERRRGLSLEERHAALQGTLEVDVGEARRSSRALVLAARQRLFDRVFDEAKLRVGDAVNGEEYRRALPRQLERALRCVGEGPITIRCPTPLAPLVRSLVRERAGTTVCADAKAAAGLFITTQDGVIEVDDTIEGRLVRQRPRLMLVVSAALESKA